MIEINVRPLYHRRQEQIGFYFERNLQLEKLVKTLPGIKWSQSNRCWYMALNEAGFTLARNMLLPVAILHINELKTYLQKRKQVLSANCLLKKDETKPLALHKGELGKLVISLENVDSLKEMIKTLHLKAYSKNTIKLYTGEMVILLKLLKDRCVKKLTASQIQSYLLWLMNKKHCSESKIHTTINALKFYFEQVLHNEKMFFEIPRPKKPIKLPVVHSAREIKNIINSKENSKHKTILMLAYATGMRVSEIVKLKIHDIDSERMVITIRQAKGKKDRQVMLSEKLLMQLRAYYKEYKPKQYLFEGVDGSEYSTRSVQEIFKSARQLSHNKKAGGIHSMTQLCHPSFRKRN